MYALCNNRRSGFEFVGSEFTRRREKYHRDADRRVTVFLDIGFTLLLETHYTIRSRKKFAAVASAKNRLQITSSHLQSRRGILFANLMIREAPERETLSWRVSTFHCADVQKKIKNEPFCITSLTVANQKNEDMLVKFILYALLPHCFEVSKIAECYIKYKSAAFSFVRQLPRATREK